jgi:transcriptional regulator with XRE-family HTH domain
MPKSNQLGQFLRKARKHKGLELRETLNQQDVAAAIGVAGSYVSLLERGDKLPSGEVLAKLADYYGEPVERLQELEALDRKAKWEAEAENRELRNQVTASHYSSGDYITDRIEWCLNCVLNDTYYEMDRKQEFHNLPVTRKALLVQLYEQETGRRLLTAEERRNVSDLINNIMDN